MNPINQQFVQTISNQVEIADVLKNRVIFFCGYPGSGKGTQGKLLADSYNIRHLSTGELFRAEANKGTEIGKKMDAYMKQGQAIPKEIIADYLKTELSKPEYRNGFILDGFIKNQETYDFIMKTLKELQLEPLAAMHFELPKEVAEKRVIARGDHRSDDNEVVIGKRMEVFEEQTMPVLKQFKESGLLVTLDAAQKVDVVFKSIISSLLDLRSKQITGGGSYQLRLSQNGDNSAVFHNHIDAKSHEILRSIVHKIDDVNLRFQNKIYPVRYLHLGPQHSDAEFASVYNQLPNFHSITEAKDEAFSTGKMGENGFDYDQVRTTLQVAYQHPNMGVMTELEEDIYAKEFNSQGEEHVSLNRGNTPYTLDWNKLPGWKEKLIPGIPRFEMHHGVDIKQEEGEVNPPILPSDLSAQTTALGFKTGGWFIFRKKGLWCYRSNEFTNKDYEPTLSNLNKQALELRKLFAAALPNREVESSCALEKVHAMWRI